MEISRKYQFKDGGRGNIGNIGYPRKGTRGGYHPLYRRHGSGGKVNKYRDRTGGYGATGERLEGVQTQKMMEHEDKGK